MPARNSSQPDVKGEEFARAAARIANENRAEDVVVLDLRGLSPVTDFFVIATGTSDRQMRAVIDEIDEYAGHVGQQRYGLSGYETGTWLLADYVDIVVHLFDRERRQYYDLELLWGDAPRIDWWQPDQP
jgi:ribosome-associated protein